jgi:adenylyl-sulfate kinase
VAEFGELLELLYTAHRDLDTIFLEIRDWSRQEASDVLIVQRDADGRTRLRPTGGGLYAKPRVGARRLWCELPDRVRVDILQGDRVVRTAVRDREAWWRWDRDQGDSAGDMARGAALPAMLDLVVLEPARLLSTMLLELTGSGGRAGREVITVTGTPRQRTAGVERRTEYEFDAEHGTPLHIATFEANERTNLTEVLTVEYSSSFDPDIFRFERNESGGGQRFGDESRSRPRRQRHTPPAAQRNTSKAASAVPILADRGTIWLTGIPGAGKTTIAKAIERLLHQLGVPCCVFDGDELRQGLSSDLGLSRQDRGEQARRAAHMATILANSGVVPIVALVSPYTEDRQRAREIHDAAGVGFLEVWVDTPLESCAARHTKGRYAAAHALSTVPASPTLDGSGLTGLTAPYETPTSPDLRVSGDQPHPRAAAIAIVEKLLSKDFQTRVLAID